MKYYKYQSIVILILTFFLNLEAKGGWSAIKCQLQCTANYCSNIQQGNQCLQNCSKNIDHCKKALEQAKNDHMKAQNPVTPEILQKLATHPPFLPYVSNKQCFECEPPQHKEDGIVYYHGGNKGPAYIYDEVKCKCLSPDGKFWQEQIFRGNEKWNQGV